MKKLKQSKLFILICSGVLLVALGFFWIAKQYNYDFSAIATIIPDFFTKNETTSTMYVVADDLIADLQDEKTLAHNTEYLQELIDEVSDNGGGTVHLPAGTFHFSAGGNDRTFESYDNGGYYVIQCRNNVLIEGEGMDEVTGTVLKPVGSYYHGLDMFYYIDDVTYVYLENADFKNFTIDGALASKNDEAAYNARGKGFMLSPVKDCDWDTVTVKNTDGTGFGMDLPVNCTIKNCIAIGNGKATTEEGIGASGFGIGSGYSEDESMYISNCIAIGNRKYGFFFEHQGRWGAFEKVDAQVAAGSNEPNSSISGFVVENSTARGNLYNFGGEKANDVTYKKCTSSPLLDTDPNPLQSTNYAAFYFTLNSRRIHLIDNTVEHTFDDVDNSSAYYDSVMWALNNGIVDGGTRRSSFQPDNPLLRAEAIALLWKMSDRNLDGVLLGDDMISTGYTDIPDVNWSSADWYVDAVLWGVEKGILSTTDSTFRPVDNCNRGDFLLMLYHLAGNPEVSEVEDGFLDVDAADDYADAVNWALSTGLIEKPSSGLFLPDTYYTRAEAVTILYKYQNDLHTVTYNGSENGGQVVGVATAEIRTGEAIDLTIAAEKPGYTFVGWNTDKNATVGLTNLKMGKEDVILYAIYRKEAVELHATFDGNGATISELEKSCLLPAVYNNEVQDTSCVIETPLANRDEYTIIGYHNDATATESAVAYQNGKLTLTIDNTDQTWYVISSKDIKLTFIDYQDAIKQTTYIEDTIYNLESATITTPTIHSYFDWTMAYWTDQEDVDADMVTTSGGMIRDINDDKTYYARYAKTIQITYDINGGVGNPPSPQVVNLRVHSANINHIVSDDIILTTEIPQKENATFLGWNQKADGTGVTYQPGQQVAFLQDMTLYATWKVTFEDYLDMSALTVDEDKKFITSLTVGMAADELMAKIRTNGKMYYIDTEGNPLDNNSVVATGNILKIELSQTTYEYTLVVVGDVRGTGRVTMADVMKVATHLLDDTVIQGEPYLLAADVTGDDNIRMNDVMKMAYYVLEGGSL